MLLYLSDFLPSQIWCEVILLRWGGSFFIRLPIREPGSHRLRLMHGRYKNAWSPSYFPFEDTSGAKQQTWPCQNAPWNQVISLIIFNLRKRRVTPGYLSVTPPGRIWHKVFFKVGIWGGGVYARAKTHALLVVGSPDPKVGHCYWFITCDVNQYLSMIPKAKRPSVNCFLSLILAIW